ncbi:MAG: HAD family hydrolase [Oscillospiraceae bacterium]|jgi:Cof subfamily protein (haloacid dehalogenase superfamily)|nr:HAD family hydrolase [Oscillospiraceae bacterium]
MKTLYISDLDGTLLNSSAELSEYSKSIINKAAAGGLIFSVATARTAATVQHILKDVTLPIPIVLMNGVSVFDIQSKKYVQTHYMEQSAAEVLLQELNAHPVSGFIFTLEDEVLSTYYERTETEHSKQFIEERQKKYYKRFTKLESFNELTKSKIIYFSVCDTKEALNGLYQVLASTEGLHAEFYRDVYEEGYWYLEVCSAKASKYNAVQFLRECYGFERVVSFGDNLNDLPMFEASDECYAVENAKPEVKQKATGIIGANTQDGVAKFIEQRIH